MEGVEREERGGGCGRGESGVEDVGEGRVGKFEREGGGGVKRLRLRVREKGSERGRREERGRDIPSFSDRVVSDVAP